MRDLTKAERDLVNALGSVWNAFLNLPVTHDNDSREFLHAIHLCQNIVLSRPSVETFDRWSAQRRRRKNRSTVPSVSDR